jgi:hypothetical protein
MVCVEVGYVLQAIMIVVRPSGWLRSLRRARMVQDKEVLDEDAMGQ